VQTRVLDGRLAGASAVTMAAARVLNVNTCIPIDL
jgi:hypothetical protein